MKILNWAKAFLSRITSVFASEPNGPMFRAKDHFIVGRQLGKTGNRLHKVNAEFAQWFLEGDGKIEPELIQDPPQLTRVLANNGESDEDLYDRAGGIDGAEISVQEFFLLLMNSRPPGLRSNFSPNYDIVFLSDRAGIVRPVVFYWHDNGTKEKGWAIIAHHMGRHDTDGTNIHLFHRNPYAVQA